MGSAMRKPRIHPGRGSASADSMIDGRTMVMGTRGCAAHQGALAQRLGEGVGVGPAERLGARPSSLDELGPDPLVAQLLGSLRQQVGPGRAELGARRLGELRQALGRARRGLEVVAQTPRRGHLGVDVDFGGDGGVGAGPRPRRHRLGGEGLGGVTLVGAGHVRGGHGDEVGGLCPGVLTLARCVATDSMAAATREGPSRLTSTAVSRGASKATVAAECTTTSHEASTSRPSSSRPSPSRPTSPATAPRRAATTCVEAVAELVAQAVEAVVAHHLACQAGRGVRPARRAHEHDHLAPRDGAQEALDEGRAQEAGGPRDEDALAGQGLGDGQGTAGGADCRGGRHLGHDLCLPYGRWAGEEGRAVGPGAPRAAPPTASSTPPWPRSGHAATRRPPWMPWPRVSACASSRSCTGSRPKRRCSRRSSTARPRSSPRRSRSSLAGAGSGWARVEAVVRSVFRLASRRPELLGLLREVGRLGPPSATRLMLVLEPLVARASSFLEEEMDAGHMRRHEPRLLLLAIYSTVVGMITEVEVLRALGEEPTPRSLVRRRQEILRLLRSALLVDGGAGRRRTPQTAGREAGAGSAAAGCSAWTGSARWVPVPCGRAGERPGRARRARGRAGPSGGPGVGRYPATTSATSSTTPPSPDVAFLALRAFWNLNTRQIR